MRLAELQPNEELSTALAAGDIHLVPQNPQAAAFAVPSKVYNIMAVGRPFVATALPDSTLWHLQRQSGAFLCVPPDEPLSFAEAVLQLADDPQLRHELGRRGREFVEQHYAKPLILSRIREPPRCPGRRTMTAQDRARSWSSNPTPKAIRWSGSSI